MIIDRREAIKEYIQDKGDVQLRELEGMFPDISSMTLRRDMAFLEEKGIIIRTRGGAISMSRVSGLGEDVYSLRAKENIDAKMKVAKKAVELIETGRSIFIDSGTTMMCLAKVMPDENLSILTSGPNIAMEIIKNSKPSITIIGGQLSRNNLSISGLYAQEFLKNINIDIAFMATSGFSLENGFTSGNFGEAELKKIIIQKARKTVLLMASDKIGKIMPFTFASLKDIDVLICDSELPENVSKAAKANQVEVY